MVTVAKQPQRVMAPERKRILAASAPWLGALLNGLPGLGSGYLYQRRWRPWWLTTVSALAWITLIWRLSPAERTSPTLPAGLLLLSGITAAEAFLAARKARHD
jgi:hypothetical protein